MSAIRTLEAARNLIKLRVAVDAVPELTDTDLDNLLEAHSMATIWAPETSYMHGDRVVPTDDVQVGRVFKCIAPGISDTEEPLWSDFTTWPYMVSAFVGSEFWDNTVAWADDGSGTNLWAIDDTVYAAWMLKAARASDLMNTNRGGNQYDFDGIYRHCIDMANRVGGHFIK